MPRTYVDRCPGVLRPWIAEDGALVRLRLVGGRLSAAALTELVAASAEYGDGNLHLTSRANLQIRGIAHTEGCVPSGLVETITAAGLLPSASHELVRNIVVSPLTGRAGGVADLVPVATALDRLLCADPALAALAGRFLFTLDDGRGDVAGRTLDLGLMALDARTVQLRVGSTHWGPTLVSTEAPAALLALARSFLSTHGSGPTALWHVDELPGKGTELLDRAYVRDDRTLATGAPPPFGMITQNDGRQALHLEIPDGTLTPRLAAQVAGLGSEVIVTPWRSVVVPDQENA